MHVEESHDPPFHVISRHADVFDVLMRPDEWRNGFGVGVNTRRPWRARHRRRSRSPSPSPGAAGHVPAGVDRRARRRGRRRWLSRTVVRAFGADGEGDFVPLFAFPFPAVVIAALLGVPRERRDDFGRWSDDIVNTPRWRRSRRWPRRRTGRSSSLVDELVDRAPVAARAGRGASRRCAVGDDARRDRGQARPPGGASAQPAAPGRRPRDHRESDLADALPADRATRVDRRVCGRIRS